jgi:hypothetical protein
MLSAGTALAKARAKPTSDAWHCPRGFQKQEILPRQGANASMRFY